MSIILEPREVNLLIDMYLVAVQRLTTAIDTCYPDDRRGNTALIREAKEALIHLKPLIDDLRGLEDELLRRD